jgi:hypothetical protein
MEEQEHQKPVVQYAISTGPQYLLSAAGGGLAGGLLGALIGILIACMRNCGCG